MYLPMIISWAVFLISLAAFGKYIALRTLGVITLFYGIMAIVPYFRTKNIGFLLTSLYMLTMTLFLFIVPPDLIFDSSGKTIPSEVAVVIIVMLLLGIWLLYLTFRRKIKWRGTEIFELAASNVGESKESYTSRPRPVDKIEYTKSDLVGFANFLQRNLISLSFVEDTRVVFTPVKNSEEIPFLYKPNIEYEDRSWVAFYFDGNVTVNISKKDYLYYKEDLAFDELCDSLGKLYLEFFELYRVGSEVRIIDKMDELKVAVMT